MPRLPAPEEYAHAAPRSTRQVVPIEHSRVGEAWSQVGRGVSRLGQDLDTLAEEETRKLDALAADNALTKLEDERMRRTFDPKDGFTRIQGTAILDKNNPILKTVPEAFNKSIEAIAGTLTPQQQQLFRAKASRVSASLRGDLYRHVAVQTEKAYDESDTARLKQAARIVGVDPLRLDQQVGEITELMSNQFTRNRVTDTAIQNVARTEAIMPLINEAMRAHTTGANPNFEAARRVMKTYDDIIPESAKKALNEEIKKEERNVVATELSENMFAAYAAGDMSITQSGAILARYGVEDKELRTEARRLFNDRVHELNLQRDETLGGLALKFEEAPSRKLMQQIMRSEEFKSMDPKRRAAFAKSADDEIWQRQMRAEHNADRARIQADRAQAKTADDTFLRFSELYDSPNLVKMSETQIWGMGVRGEISKEYAKTLVTARKQRLAQGGAYDFEKAQVEEATAGLKKEDKARATAALYENLTAWKERNPGRAPTVPEQEQIIKNALLPIPTKQSFLGAEWAVKGRPVYMRGTGEGEEDETLYRGTEPPVPIRKDFAEEMRARAARTGRNLTQLELSQLWDIELERRKGRK